MAAPRLRTTPPRAQGLYDPRFEHDACGVGFVVNIKGQRSHSVVERGLEVLRLAGTVWATCSCHAMRLSGSRSGS